MDSDRLIALLEPELREQLEPHRPALQRWLTTELVAAESAWQGVHVARERFLHYLAAHFPGDVEPARLFSSWRLAELYLSCACVDGDRAALVAFEARFKKVIDSSLSRQRLREPLLSEAKQALRVMLFTGKMVISHYTGPGELGSWLWVVATRHAHKLLGKEARLVPVKTDEIQARLFDAPESAECALARDTYRDAFKRSFRQAMESLTEHQLALLRYRYADGLGVKEIGRIYRVHHSTISRRVDQVRNALRERTAAALMEELDLSTDACVSIVGLFRSDFDVSITTLLG